MVTTGAFGGKPIRRDGRGLYVAVYRTMARNPRLDADAVASFEVVDQTAPAGGGSFLGMPTTGILGRATGPTRALVVVRMAWKDGRTSVLLLEQDDFDLFDHDARPGWESNPRPSD